MDESNRPIQQVVIVGGGTAGWLTACILGAEFESGEQGLAITLVESPDTPTIGVGEGTWPSMRSTLKKDRDFRNHFYAALWRLAETGAPTFDNGARMLQATATTTLSRHR